MCSDVVHVKLIYEKVNLVLPLPQRRFFNYLNDTISELRARFGLTEADLLFDSYNKQENMRQDEIPLVMSLDEYIPILNLYIPAMVDNILFLAGAGEGYKSEFLRKADEAHTSYWRKNAKSKKIKRMRW